jgi:hypothetical protein
MGTFTALFNGYEEPPKSPEPPHAMPENTASTAMATPTHRPRSETPDQNYLRQYKFNKIFGITF